MDDFLTTNAVAKLMNIAPDTVRFYERTGRLVALRTTSGIRLFRREDVEDFIAKRNAIHDERLVGSQARS
jgi:excisionase family DNA binding protein